MIRVILFLVSIAIIAASFAWIADRPGEVAITWMGYRIETSVMVAVFAVSVLALAVMLLWSIVRAILHSPEQASLFLRHRRAAKGYHAISRGLIAIGAGDLRVARKSADEAARLSPGGLGEVASAAWRTRLRWSLAPTRASARRSRASWPPRD